MSSVPRTGLPALLLALGGIALGGMAARADTVKLPDTVVPAPIPYPQILQYVAPPTPCAFCWADVYADGYLFRTKGSVGVIKLATGQYDVRFRYQTVGCTFQATIGRSEPTMDTFGSGEVTVVGRVGTRNGVFVATFDSAGHAADKPFGLIVIC